MNTVHEASVWNWGAFNLSERVENNEAVCHFRGKVMKRDGFIMLQTRCAEAVLRKLVVKMTHCGLGERLLARNN